MKHSNRNSQLALKIQAIVVRRREGKVHAAIGLKKKTKIWLMLCNIPATPGLAIVTSDSYLGS
jgi:hypothetical protein